jgi:hypothetical protein
MSSFTNCLPALLTTNTDEQDDTGNALAAARCHPQRLPPCTAEHRVNWTQHPSVCTAGYQPQVHAHPSAAPGHMHMPNRQCVPACMHATRRGGRCGLRPPSAVGVVGVSWSLPAPPMLLQGWHSALLVGCSWCCCCLLCWSGFGQSAGGSCRAERHLGIACEGA